MLCNDNKNNTRISEINLLSNFKKKQKWIPFSFLQQNEWKVLSGKWKSESSDRVVCYRDSNVKMGENISIIGSRHWNNFILNVNFKILSNSIKPPQGGVILYFLFKNSKSYYSFHFCLCKNKIEFIKRIRGVWTTKAEHNFDLTIEKNYLVTISTFSDVHRCRVDGRDFIEISDDDISRGCIGIGTKYCEAVFSRVTISQQSDFG
jgi:hypothetical protein